MEHYFVFDNNRAMGPFDGEELMKKVASGEITERQLISTDGRNWSPASEIFPETDVEPIETAKPPSPKVPSQPQTEIVSFGWFYAKDGKVIGPLPEDALRGLAHAGVIKAGDFVWSTGQPGAIPAIQSPILSDMFHDAAPNNPAAYPHPNPSAHPHNSNHFVPRPQNQPPPISNQGVVWTFWLVTIIGIVSLVLNLGRSDINEKENIGDLLTIVFAVALLLFIIFYLQALYRCWANLHLAGDTRWPSPAWVMVISIGTSLITIIPSPITLLIDVVGMYYTHVGLGKRLKAILEKITPAADKLKRSKTTDWAQSLIAVNFIGGIWLNASTPANYEYRMVLVVLIGLSQAYYFICSAVKDVNRIHQQAG